MENNQIQDNGPAENTVDAQSNPIEVDNISEAINTLLFGSEQEQNPEGSKLEGEDQPEDKDSETDANQEYEDPQAEDGEDQVHSQTEEVREEEILPNGVQKRIDKLTARNKSYEEKISELNLKMSELEGKINSESQVQKQEVAKPMSQNPFGHLETPEAIQAELENAKWLRFKCEENPEGFTLGDSYVDAEQVRTMKVNALKAIEIHLPKQYQHLNALQHFNGIAVKEYPWWGKPESQEQQMANQVLKNFPQFRNFPDFQLFVGDYVKGYMLRTGKQASQPIARAAQPISVRPKTAPSNTVRNVSSEKGAYERFVKSGGKEGLAKLLLQKGII